VTLSDQNFTKPWHGLSIYKKAVQSCDNFSDPFSGDLIQGKSQLLFGRIIIYWDAMDV
jgi:hypothetical protein